MSNPVHTYTNPSSYPEIAESRWGRDLFVADGCDGETRATATGDWPTIAGRENLHWAHRRRALTLPGEVTHRPEYGGGLIASVGTLADAPSVVARVVALRNNAARDLRLADARADAKLTTAGVVVYTLELRPRGEPDPLQVTVQSPKV